jgi:hypothetical protein
VELGADLQFGPLGVSRQKSRQVLAGDRLLSNSSKINLTNFLIASCQHHSQHRAGNP